MADAGKDDAQSDRVQKQADNGLDGDQQRPPVAVIWAGIAVP